MIIIDANSILYRSFHGIPEMNRKDGLPTNALYGLARQLLKIRKMWPDEYHVVVFDHPGGSFREKIFPAYKADRTRPEAYTPQAREARKLAIDLGFPLFEQPGYEADDTIAHLVALWLQTTQPDDGSFVRIVTGDKDMLQLVNDDRNILVYDPWADENRGVDACIKKFGVTPDKVPLVQALMGDGVDGIPGVPGIGPKKAAALINEHDSLEAILRAARTQPKGVMWANIRTVGEDLLMFYQLALLTTATPLTVQKVLDTIDAVVYDRDTAQAALDRYEFDSLSL